MEMDIDKVIADGQDLSNRILESSMHRTYWLRSHQSGKPEPPYIAGELPTETVMPRVRGGIVAPSDLMLGSYTVKNNREAFVPSSKEYKPYRVKYNWLQRLAIKVFRLHGHG